MNRQAPPHAFPSIKAITFDADDTLWDFQSAMESALESTLRQLRLIVPNAASDQLTVQKMIDIREHVARELGEALVFTLYVSLHDDRCAYLRLGTRRGLSGPKHRRLEHQ